MDGMDIWMDWICHREDRFLFHPVSISREKPEITTERHTGGNLGWTLWFTTLVLPLVPPQKFPLLEGSQALTCVKALCKLWDKNQKLQQ